MEAQALNDSYAFWTKLCGPCDRLINSSKFTNSKNKQYWPFIQLNEEKNKAIKGESEKQFKSLGCLSNKLYYI